MLTLAILGFLAEEPLHGYELRSRIGRLSGHARPVSDGSLYPAINRLVAAGMLERRTVPGVSAANRQLLELTAAGLGQLHDRLRKPSTIDITDSTRFFTVLAFLSQLPAPADQHAVLRRRLDFLERPAGFFEPGGGGKPNPDTDDVYRKGMLTVARATNRAERTWLRGILAAATDDGAVG